MIKRVGLTGGIGSGKSEVARILEELGAFIVDTDELARDAVAPNSDGFMAIARTWPAVVRENRLDRAALAQIVFSDPAALKRLNAIVHPFVRMLADEREKLAKPGQLIVHVVPLLFETGYADRVEKSIVVIAPDEERIRRVTQRDRVEDSAVRARMASQMDPSAARARADFVVENDGNLGHLRERVQAVYEALQ